MIEWDLLVAARARSFSEFSAYMLIDWGAMNGTRVVRDHE
jgi:hypothetical protein